MKLARWTAEQVENLVEECISNLETVVDDSTLFEYVLTPMEADYLRWIGDRYQVTKTLLRQLREDDNGVEYITIDPWHVGWDLAEEGLDRLPCLSESSTLNRIVWFIGPKEWE